MIECPLISIRIDSNGVGSAVERRRQKRKPHLAAALKVALDPELAAKRAALRYVRDSMRGITRHKARNGFDYCLPDGSLMRDIATLKRIRALAIPPPWIDVWICPDPNGHLQAVDRDQRGRKQYRYHPRWREVRDEAKFSTTRLMIKCPKPRICSEICGVSGSVVLASDGCFRQSASTSCESGCGSPRSLLRT